jgi:hypothetical protein
MGIKIDIKNSNVQSSGMKIGKDSVQIGDLTFDIPPGSHVSIAGDGEGNLIISGVTEQVPEFPPAKTQIATVIDMHSWKGK